ncbi:hypothetical protein [Streptomyces goshikiensis]|uniref:hypothetical protein n=1 Tax=Streptomyces goshikiensis TaxID=1942 RepID=UPI00372050BE
MPKRNDVVRQHSEDAAAFSRLASESTGATRREYEALAADHQAYADMARHGEYPTDLDD